MPETKTCPFCAEEVLAAAIKCKHCGSELSAGAGLAQSRVGSRIFPSGPKHGVLAGALNFACVAGAGHLYIGQVEKALIICVVDIVLAFFTWGLSHLVLGALVAVDAHRLANRLNKGESIGVWEWDVAFVGGDRSRRPTTSGAVTPRVVAAGWGLVVAGLGYLAYGTLFIAMNGPFFDGDELILLFNSVASTRGLLCAVLIVWLGLVALVSGVGVLRRYRAAVLAVLLLPAAMIPVMSFRGGPSVLTAALLVVLSVALVVVMMVRDHLTEPLSAKASLVIGATAILAVAALGAAHMRFAAAHAERMRTVLNRLEDGGSVRR